MRIFVPLTSDLNSKSLFVFCLNTPAPSPLLDAVIVSPVLSSEKLALTFRNAVLRSSPSPSFTKFPTLIVCKSASLFSYL